MRSATKTILTGTTAAILALTLAACSGGESPGGGDGTGSGNGATDGSGEVTEGGEINIAWPSQPTTLDPVATPATSPNFIAYNVFEGIIALDGNFAVQPVLAESYEVNDDFTAFSFTMRSDVLFHNGEPMVIDDVVASIERWITDTSAGQAYFADAEVTSSDDVVTITVPETLYTGLFHLAQPTQQLVVMPAASIAAKDDTGVPTELLIGTGPFAIESMTVDQNVTLSRFDDYVARDGEASGVTGEKIAHADTLVFNIVPDATTRLNGIQSGQYDYATDIPADNVAQLEADPSITVNTLSSGILSLVFDKAEGPMADVQLRQAVQAALNIDDIMISTYNSEDYFDLNGALAGPEQADWYTEAGLDHYNQQDLDLAAQLIEESDYDGEPIIFLTTRDYAYMYNSAVVVAEQLESIGLNIDLEVTDWGTILTKIYEPESFDMFVTDFLRRPVPLAYTFFNSTYAGSTDDPAITSAIAEINAATTAEEGLAAQEALQAAFYEYVPVVKFGDIRSITAQRDTVGGFIPFIGPVFYGSYLAG